MALVHVGDIKAHMGSGPLDADWLELDGSTFDAGTYPELAAFLGGTTLPNASNRFLRGGIPGVLEGFVEHTHTGTTAAAGSLNVGILGVLTAAAPAGHTHTFTTGSTSHIPLNIGVTWWIRATPDPTEGRLDAAEGRLDDAEADITALEGTVSTHGTRLDDAEADITALEGTVGTHGTRLDDVEAGITGLEAIPVTGAENTSYPNATTQVRFKARFQRPHATDPELVNVAADSAWWTLVRIPVGSDPATVHAQGVLALDAGGFTGTALATGLPQGTYVLACTARINGVLTQTGYHAFRIRADGELEGGSGDDSAGLAQSLEGILVEAGQEVTPETWEAGVVDRRVRNSSAGLIGVDSLLRDIESPKRSLEVEHEYPPGMWSVGQDFNLSTGNPVVDGTYEVYEVRPNGRGGSVLVLGRQPPTLTGDQSREESRLNRRERF